jgi:hypothetical protein
LVKNVAKDSNGDLVEARINNYGLMVNPESNWWIQYNQFIFFFQVENNYSTMKTNVKLMKYNLEDKTTTLHKQYADFGEEKCKVQQTNFE